MKLHIADNLSLPLDTLTQAFAILGIRGSGKTHTATVLVEEMLKAGQPVCIYDPTGAWWGLKSSPDGKRPGFPVVVFGGEHPDVPLVETAGETIARVIVEKRVPAVLDCSLMRKAARVRFMTDFCEVLYQRNREPLHFVADEAHTICPQRPFPEVARLLGAVEDIILQGRRRGLGCTIISQRPALVNKNITTQCGTLVAMRIVGPQDRAAVEDWIQMHGDREQAKELLASLPALKVGEGWLWSPGWLGKLVRTHFRQRETFDSSATPEVGKRAVVPKVVAEIDLAALGQEIQATVERAKADDPRELRLQIAELKKQLAAKPTIGPAEPLRIEIPVLTKEHTESIKRLLAEVSTVSGEVRGLAIDMGRNVKPLEEALNRVTKAPQAHRPPSKPHVAAPPRPRSVPQTRHHESNGTAEPSVGRGGLRRILVALAQRPGLTNSQLGLRAELSSKSGSFSTYLSTARKAGWLRDEGDRHFITDAGVEALGSYDPLPEGRDLLDYWLRELGDSGAARMLRALADVYPESLTNEQLGEAAEISHTSGSFSTYLSTLRRLELIQGQRGSPLRASEEFFE